MKKRCQSLWLLHKPQIETANSGMTCLQGRYKILCASIAEHKDRRRTRRLIWRHMKRIALRRYTVLCAV